MKPNDQLPSIRQLATNLQVGIITVKRAYDDLANEGFLISRMGKGFFISEINLAQIKKEYLKELHAKITDLKPLIKDTGLNKKELIHLLEQVMGE